MLNKKIVAIFLVLVITFSQVAFADEYKVRDDSTKPVVHDEGNPLAKLNYSINTEFDGIKRAPSGQYAMQVATDNGMVSIPVGKYALDLMNAKNYDALRKTKNISREIRESLEENRESLAATGNTNVKVTIFSPDLLQTNTAMSRSTGYVYTTYKGVQMKSEQVFYEGINSGTKSIKTGKTTADYASGLKEFIVIAASEASKKFSLTANAISLLKAFGVKFPNYETLANTSDFLEFRVIYDKVDQWTYGSTANGWKCGLRSQKVKIKDVRTELHLFTVQTKKGETNPVTVKPNKSYTTKNFSSPWAETYKWFTGTNEVERLSWKPGSTTYYF